MTDYISTSDRMLLQAIADGDITWENSRPGAAYAGDYDFVWQGRTVDYETGQALDRLADGGFLVREVGLPLTDAGRVVLAHGGDR